MTLAAWVTLIITCLVGTTGSGGVIYWLLQRNSQKTLDRKIDGERDKLEADAVKTWHELWDQNAKGAYNELDRRCNRCEKNLGQVCELFTHFIGDVVNHLKEPGSVDLDRQLIVAQRELAKYTPN